MLSLLISAALAGSWDLQNVAAARIFPLGARDSIHADYLIPLWNSDSVLFEDTYIAPGLYADITPAYAHLGARLKWSPIAVFEVTTQFDGGYYFGTFSGVTDFYSADTPYDDAHLDALAAAGHSNRGTVLRGMVSPTLQARVGNVIIALPQDFYFFWKTRPEGAACTGGSSDFSDGDSIQDCIGDYWYEPQFDAMLKWNDTIMNNGAVAFWSFRDSTETDPRKFWLGLKFDRQYVLGTQDTSVRLGPIALFKFGKSNAVPTFAVFTQVYLDSRIHETVPPYIAAASIW